MKKMLIAAVCGAQLLAVAPPAAAAELPQDQPAGATRMGTFVGARVRVPLGSTREKAHAGLAFTATQRSGEAGTLRFSKGMELGLAGDEKVRLSVGGRSLSQLSPSGAGSDGRKLGVSGAGWTAISVGLVAVAVGGLYIWLVSNQCDCE
jgi:opacity protein-like surface antigen